MKTSTALFTAFILLAAAEVLGVAVLSRVPPGELNTDLGLASLWLAWMFGLWGALILAVVFTIAWVAEKMTDVAEPADAGSMARALKTTDRQVAA